MPALTVAPTVPQIKGTTRRNIIAMLLRDTGLGEYGTCTGGTTATIVDTTSRLSSQFSSREYVGGWVRISRDAGGAAAAPEGDIRAITSYDPNTGTLQVSPAFSASPASGDSYEIWRTPDPQKVLDIIDDTLADTLYSPCWTILSEVPDYDMEQSTLTDWTASNATLTKQTGEPHLSGKRHLRVVATSANGYARSALIEVGPGRQYHCSALTRCTAAATTAKLQLWDETNGVEIAAYTSTRLHSARIWFQGSIPATCNQVSLRLKTVENAQTTEWDEVCFFDMEGKDVALPWWAKKRSQIKGIFRMSPRVIDQNLMDSTLIGEHNSDYDIISDQFGRGQLRVQARQSGMSSPLFVLGIRNETAYLNDNGDIKFIDNGFFVAAIAVAIYKYLTQPLVTSGLDKLDVQKALAYWNKIYSDFSYQELEELNRTITSPTPYGLFADNRFRFGA